MDEKMNQTTLPTPDEIERSIGVSRGAARRRWMKRLVWLALLGALLIGGWQWYASRQAQAKAVTYDTVETGHRDLTITVSATGTIQPLTQVDVGSELSGVAREVLVAENDQVKAGDVLARLDTTRLLAQRAKAEAQLAAARARIITAQASVSQNEQSLTRQSRLRARSLSSEQDLETADAEMKRSEAGLAVARADEKAAEADLALINADLAKADIVSPINGMVLKRSVEPGQTVAASLQAPVLFTLAQDLSRIQLEANVDEADVGVVKPEQSATFTVDAYREQSFPAKIERMSFSPQTVDGVVTYMTYLSAANKDLALRPGMTATAKITVAEHKNVIAIPNEALRYTPPKLEQSQGFSIMQIFMPRFPRNDRAKKMVSADGLRSIYVLEGNTPKEVRVKTGASDGAFTLIESGDLTDGDQLITASRQGSAP
jgi:HlyD family secretion protein